MQGRIDKGRDPLIHHGTCDGMLACALDTFTAGNKVSDYRSAARELRKSVQLLKREMHAQSVFRPALFRLIASAATEIAIERGFIKRN